MTFEHNKSAISYYYTYVQSYTIDTHNVMILGKIESGSNQPITFLNLLFLLISQINRHKIKCIILYLINKYLDQSILLHERGFVDP